MPLVRGHVSLKPLLAYVKGRPEIPVRRNESSRAYRKAINELCAEIPARGGLYLWGAFERSGQWKNIYLGKSSRRKALGLRSRITEELRDEFIALWLVFHDEASVMKQIRDAYGDRYDWHQQRSKRKKGTEFIVWAGYDDGEYDLSAEENALIARYRPRANATPGRLVENQYSKAACQAFDAEIEAIRSIQSMQTG
jgi:hypothetical protein